MFKAMMIPIFQGGRAGDKEGYTLVLQSAAAAMAAAKAAARQRRRKGNAATAMQ